MSNKRPSDVIRGLPGPASELPWSRDFVMQAIEVLPVLLRAGVIHCLQPEHAASFIVGWPAGRKPEEVVLEALEGLGLAPLVLHSTSWRHSGAEVVLTYFAVVPPETAPPSSWTVGPVKHTELARGGAITPPSAIETSQVLEHALRHLTWLVKEDGEIRGALAEWEAALEGYVPEPFRALGGPSQ